MEMSRLGFFRIQNRLEERLGLNHGLEHGKWKKKTKSKHFWVGFFFVRKGSCDVSSRSSGVSGVFFAQRLPRAPKARAWVNHGLEHLKQGQKLSQKNFFWVRFLLSKKVYVMFLRVSEVFLGCFTRSACREHRRREHGSKPRS